MLEIDEAIGQVSNLYRAVTGREIPQHETASAAIPAEKDPVLHVQEQMDRLMALMGSMGSVAARNMSSSILGGRVPQPWMPALSVWESEKEVLLCFDIPGVTREHVEVNVEGTFLLVAGDRPAPVANGHQLRASERPTGAFRRVVSLPFGLRTQEMAANLKDGVLEVRIPREPHQKPAQRRVPVS